MKTIALCTALCALAVLLIPTAARERAVQPALPEDRVLLIESAAAPADEPQPAASCTVTLLTGGETETLDLDTYLTSVVLCEMPPTFEPQALCAQAVAARTFVCRQMQHGKHPNGAVCDDSACCQAWRSREALEEKFGADFADYWQKAADAVAATHDEVLTYDGKLIDATYFSCSGGRTEAAVAVWGSDVPYLQSVASYGEQSALRYESGVTVTPEQFRDTIQPLAPDAMLDGPPDRWCGDVTHTEGGGVATMTIGGAALTGTELRRAFSLNSTQFTLTYTDGAFHFDVLGFGHRVGMSQYGANYMASLGYSYRVILPYYYRGAVLKTLDTLE